MSEPIKDKRFAHMQTDPRFKRISKRKTKVKVDDRFKGMFTDSSFATSTRVDARGKVLRHSQNEDLRKYYDLDEESDKKQSKSRDGDEDEEQEDQDSDALEETELGEQDDEEEEEEEDEEERVQRKKTLKEEDSEDEEEEEEDEDDDEDEEAAAPQEGYDPMRGVGVESSSESEDDEEQDDNEDPWTLFQQMDKVEYDDETSSRLAVVNMDWDKIRAPDLLVLANSFKPPQGVIQRVTVYPSEFGKKCMAEEEKHGPGDMIRSLLPDIVSRDQAAQAKRDEDRLRAYQLQRLRYYYAIIECDSKRTAEAIYKQCDGLEYGHSSNCVDMRYVPSDEEFDDEPRETVTDIPADDFEAREFTTAALQQSKVKFTWDGDDQDRLKATRRRFGKDDLKRMDLEAYIASDSESEDEAAREATRNSYRALIDDLKAEHEQEDETPEMEITFDVGLKEASEQLLKRRQEKLSEEKLTLGEKFAKAKKDKRKQARKAKLKQHDDELVDSDDELDPELQSDPYFKETLQEMDQDLGKAAPSKKDDEDDVSKEEQAKEKARLELLVDAEEDEHFNMKEIIKNEKRSTKTKKRRAKKSKDRDEANPTRKDTFEIATGDDRFAALYTDNDFSIDPTNPSFVETNNMTKLLKEKRKRQHAKRKADPADAAVAPKGAGLEQLVAKLKKGKRGAKAAKRQ